MLRMHTDADAMTGEKVSAEFVVDTTPPVPGVLTAAMVAGTAKIHATLEARDAMSPIAHAEYSVDAGRGSMWSRLGSFRTRWRSGMTLWRRFQM